ncbi:hypothetical protein DA075_35385 (plasmid) [Methylobacterium currus]|uniref:Flagellar biosynthesis repressor FlbT n=1 Tax=Methylobacterium currus TaxID=2051553 RepID=A0A2R4WWI3_9HYPH|nr:hypothetical protein DA075_34305 [Methylobacterium currus]AWB26138.1 hypothetical protein DA075_35385 [Methylobacterium currus]
MALRIDLKPHERVIVGNVSIRNVDRRASLTFETKTEFLREKDILAENQARTVCERLYVTLQAVYITDNYIEVENAFISSTTETIKAAPSMGCIYQSLIRKSYVIISIKLSKSVKSL